MLDCPCLAAKATLLWVIETTERFFPNRTFMSLHWFFVNIFDTHNFCSFAHGVFAGGRRAPPQVMKVGWTLDAIGAQLVC